MRIAGSIAVAVFVMLGTATNVRAERGTCEVVFVRAPDEVRLVIESWLKAEPRCSGTIELRVLETESGSLYLIAQRPDGRIHEREVPDAQSAGVLVASWVADDWTSAPPADDVPDKVVAPITMAPVEAQANESPPPAPRETGRWFSVAGLLAMSGEGGAGARFEMDLWGGRSSKWTLGFTLSGFSSQMNRPTEQGFATLETMDLRALFVASRTWRLGETWNVRWSVGLGPMYTDATSHVWNPPTPDTMQVMSIDGASMSYESSLTLAREMFDHRWAITAGPSAMMTSQELEGSDGVIVRDGVQLAFMLGARYRL
jgi:hypothetical protein